MKSDCCGADYKLSVWGEKWECCECGHLCKVTTDINAYVKDFIKKEEKK